jgi:hypothetical protein
VTLDLHLGDDTVMAEVGRTSSLPRVLPHPGSSRMSVSIRIGLPAGGKSNERRSDRRRVHIRGFRGAALMIGVICGKRRGRQQCMGLRSKFALMGDPNSGDVGVPF